MSFEFEHFGGDLWTLRGLDCTTLEGSADEWCALADALMCGGGEAGGYRCRARFVVPARGRTGRWELWSPRNAVSADDRALLSREAGLELWRVIAAALAAPLPGEPTHTGGEG